MYMKTRYKKFTSIFLIAALCHLGVGQSAAAFTIGEEREVGEKLLYTIRSAYELIDDPDVSQYINSLGRDVLQVAGIQYFDYHFFIINESEFNAFAAPSGLIFFNSGLIGTMNSENELVSVMAHEIGHIAKRHLASRMEKGKIVSIASLGMALAALALGSGAAAPTLFVGSLAVGQSAVLQFSRQDEEEADLLAYGWMKKMGRNPEGEERMLQTMRRIARYRSEKMPQYLLTHPDSEARLDYVQSLLENESKEAKKYSSVNEFAFLRFKYRIMSLVKDQSTLRTYLANIMGNAQSTPLAVNMAKYGMSQLDRLENNFDSSLKLLNEVIAAYPQYPILLVDRAVIQLAAGRDVEATKTLQGVLQKDKENVHAMFYLAKSLIQQGKQREAEEYLKEVALEMPEYSKVYFELGQLAANQGKAGASSCYLGKYYLYEGKIPLARQNFLIAVRNTSTPDILRKESQALLDTIKRLEGAD